MWEKFKKKILNLLSRKFMATIAVVVTGISLIVKGSVAVGGGMIVAAVVSYLIVEGYIDAKTASTVLNTSSDVISAVSSITPNTIDDVAAGVVEQAASTVEDVAEDISKESEAS